MQNFETIDLTSFFPFLVVGDFLIFNLVEIGFEILGVEYLKILYKLRIFLLTVGSSR